MKNSGWPDSLPRAGNRRLTRVEGVSPWFEIYRVTDDTFALLEPRHREEVISYLIVGDERALLFDTGMGIANIRAQIDRLTAGEVVVLNSHSHYDHIGGNHRFGEIWAFDNDFEISRIERGYNSVECKEYMSVGSYLDLPPGFDLESYSIYPSRPTRRLSHLEQIELGDRRLTVHHTPGETPGSICLFDSRHGLLFTGDTFYPGMLWAYQEESSFNDYRRSFGYLVDMLDQVSGLCPAHNEALVSKEKLREAQDGFDLIAGGRVGYEVEGTIRIYRFRGFGIALRHSPDG